jgi:hypothetical protein
MKALRVETPARKVSIFFVKFQIILHMHVGKERSDMETFQAMKIALL